MMGPSSKPYRRRLLRAAAVVGAFLGTGCAVPWTGKDGTRHHLIVGLGWVRAGSQTGVVAEDIRALGLTAHSGGGAVGLFRRHRVELDPRAASNAVVAIRSGGGGLAVTNFAVVPNLQSPITP
jgi:hypothetical protein